MRKRTPVANAPTLRFARSAAFFSAASSTIALAILVVACGNDVSPVIGASDGGSTAPDGDIAAADSSPPAKDASVVDDGGGFKDADANDANDDANDASDAVGPFSCTPQLPAMFAPVFKSPTKAAACSDLDLATYYDVCVAPLATSPDAGPGCSAWFSSHGVCGQCIESPTDNNGPIQFHESRLYYTLNVAGCLSILRNETAVGTCAATYSDAIQCMRTSCTGCLKTINATFSDFQKCQQDAKASVCAAYETSRSNACGPTFNTPDGGAWDCFNHVGETTKTHFVRVEKIFCGQ